MRNQSATNSPAVNIFTKSPESLSQHWQRQPGFPGSGRSGGQISIPGNGCCPLPTALIDAPTPAPTVSAQSRWHAGCSGNLLFGAPFLDEIHAGYEKINPLEPGWVERTPLHQLHPLAVHGPAYGVALVEAAEVTITLLGR